MMLSTLAPPFLAAAFVLAGSLDYDPRILTLRWPDGHEERIAATSPDTCATAVRAVGLAIWPAGQPPPVSASCRPGNGFAAVDRQPTDLIRGAHCIRGFNCEHPR